MFWHIFYTEKGWAAFLGKQTIIIATVLPITEPLSLFKHRLRGYNTVMIEDNNDTFPLANKIRGYFKGEIIADWGVELDLKRYPDYSRKVLNYVHKIPYGETQTYGLVAVKTDNPRASRAVGRIMSANPIPLIIPCHRVIAKKGWGGFTAPGGIHTKCSMLLWEQHNLSKVKRF